ncbi:hypothetical protein Q4Q40_03025 [Flavivirga jejuensis]|uniref:Uncharacterized protein n=1 Tax=Flavivirga jejuensis TaxID=870487 RepID=A0ABT8WJ05_9FLAO|nr:hypothetical protein [Flavivirga jejuensis]MDO5973144.1 hypothetical protein [Flavivirga jejuensis]
MRVKKSNYNSNNLNSLFSQKLSEANKALITLQSKNKDAPQTKLRKRYISLAAMLFPSK